MAQAEYVINPIRALVTGAKAIPSTSPIRAAHAEFIDAMAGHSLRLISVDDDAINLEDRADHLNKALSALSVYVTAIPDESAQNLLRGLDLCHIGAVLAGLASDVTGSIRHATDGMAGRVA